MVGGTECGAVPERVACSRCILEEIGVQEDDLSQAGRRSLHILAQAGRVLKVDQVHMSEYLRAMDKLSTREEIAAEAIAALHDDMKKNTLRNDRARRELAHIIHMHDTMRNMAEEREITENSSMFKHWSRDCEEKERHYAQEIERCNAELRSRRFPLDESLEHHTLVSLAEDCASIEASTYDLAAQLSFYRALPSTVMEAQRALEAMEAEFTHEAADGVESS
ncbi:hypothetical protein, variant 3 [Aphanomyces invadans]|uniref:Uncharacterized protein n=1 Tax=Aphanomyces invadans TaxID=157072 RepID=A0A024TM47_9STRA|nr:hypothetical protein, variant 3 [Aphanomyces invadans]ETV95108.1 hypothetical protein, variant 3 [Aphanomyces invadans]|eukprot:XP_008876279.1 hypothetical protein, variant 3 [Aphanomyces invadans]